MSNLLNEILAETEQGSELWEKIRLGKFTSSEIWKLLCKKGPLTQQALTYINEKAAEILTGESKSFDNEATVWGHTNEPLAREEFEKKLNLKVLPTGFIMRDEFYGGSPDGLIDEDGLIEIKCPFNTSNHIAHCIVKSQAELKDNHPKYYYQIQSNLNVTGRSYAFFVSYDPRLQNAGFYSILVKKDEEAIDLINTSVEKGTVMLKEILSVLNAA
jgi:predicted phage-related endonuclease